METSVENPISPITLREGATLSVRGGQLIIREVLEDESVRYSYMSGSGQLVRQPFPPAAAAPEYSM